jgi:hypothetical protein
MRTGPGLSYYERTWALVNSSIEKKERSRKKRNEKELARATNNRSGMWLLLFLNLYSLYHIPITAE